MKKLTFFDVADRMKEATDNEGTFGLVFPVHSWGIPKVVEKFIYKELGGMPAAIYQTGVTHTSTAM